MDKSKSMFMGKRFCDMSRKELERALYIMGLNSQVEADRRRRDIKGLTATKVTGVFETIEIDLGEIEFNAPSSLELSTKHECYKPLTIPKNRHHPRKEP